MALDVLRETVALMSAKRIKAKEIAEAIGKCIDTVYDYQHEEEVQRRKAEYELEMREEIRARQKVFVGKIFDLQEESLQTLHEVITTKGRIRCKMCGEEIELKCPKCGRVVDVAMGAREQVAACKTAVDSAVKLIQVQAGENEPARIPTLSVEMHEHQEVHMHEGGKE